jgi:hypothetical protein
VTKEQIIITANKKRLDEIHTEILALRREARDGEWKLNREAKMLEAEIENLERISR